MKLDLQRIALVCQDWGGIIGLTIPAEMPERFSRLLVMNPAISIGKPVSECFVQDWGDQVARAALEAFGLAVTG